MATTVFSWAASRAVQHGYFLGPLSAGGHNAYRWGANFSQVRGVFTGTDLEALVYVDAAMDLNIQVDGGAWVNLTLPAAAWGYRFVASGLTEGAHTFILRNGSGSQPYIDTDTPFRVTGAAPAMAAPVNLGTQKVLRDAGVSPYVAAEGLVNSSAAGYGCLYSTWLDSDLLFRASCTEIRLWMFCNGVTVSLVQDGVVVASVTTATTNTWEMVTLSTDRDPATQHTYLIRNGSADWYAYALYTVGGTGLNQTDLVLARDQWGFYGDSILNSYALPNSILGFVARMGVFGGVSTANRAISGTRVKNVGSTSGSVRFADITGLGLGVLTRVVILYGTNDMMPTGLPTETTAEFQAAYIVMLNGIIAGTSGAVPIDCLGILPRTDVTPNTLALWNACIVAAIAACSRPSRCRYVDTSAWICKSVGGTDAFTDPNGDLSDGVHPTSSGYARMATAYNALLPSANRPGSASHPDYLFTYTGPLVLLMDDSTPLKWSVIRGDGVTPASPLLATVTVRTGGGALVSTLIPDLDPSPAAGSIVLAALWAVPAIGTYTAQLTLTMPVDGQIRSDRQIVLVR